ncbi:MULTISPECIES: ABC transporter permease [Frankia]|uniref:Dipeptide transport protein (ABC superfamily, membrane) n=1 Tax=Frankia alni (strain DSM 45986 / CECT 9034 / ACN14a) TaxID=326424 RepID=Q0RET5_FRAAA|nr:MULTISPECIES: ABC transporter permease [Frankia]CAJ64021.1 putative dipeptide transport protein (ABC superfamily, membrane) [Frankia alni ACN14a]
MIRTLLRLTSARVALALLAIIAVVAVLGPVLAPYDPLKGSDRTLAGPSASHLLGTDYIGRDVLSRILAGAPLSILSALEVAGIALVLGTIPGILSVYLGSVFEWLSLRVVDTFIALPFLVFAVAMTALLGNGITQAMIVVGMLIAPVFYRVSRAATMSVARSQYVEAASIAGASTSWIVRSHVWSKVLPSIAVTLATTLGIGLVVISSLTFLGIGIQPPTPTWGGILASDLGYLAQKPYAPVFPTLLILAAVLACNLLADAIRDAAGETGRALTGEKTARSNRTRRLAALAELADPTDPSRP